MQRYVAPFVLALSALTLVSRPLVTSAQSAAPAPIPTPVPLPTVPASAKIDPLTQYGINVLIDLAKQQVTARSNASSGIVSYYKRFDLNLQTGPNAYRNVHLHQGTVINPRGQSIAPGQRVDISGRTEPDGSLDADTITIDS